MLPFLQHSAQPGMTLVSILTSSQDTDECAAVAEALELAVRAQHDDVLLLASTDLSHYHTVEAGSLVDRALLEQVQAVDGPGLLGVARAQHARMCGVGATATILMAAARLGARVGIPLAYGTSVPANGDRHSVIGYAGVAIVSEPV